jgi:tetratricopeptide (TPR) repeat protein
MDGRISLGFLAAALALGASGCVTTQTPTTVAGPDKNATAASSTTTVIKPDDTPWPKHDRDHKRDPLASTEIAFGKMKEAEADAVQLKGSPEAQARLRDEARKAYQQAIKLDPTSLEGTRHLGRLYVKMGDTDRALETYKKAMPKHAKEGGLWYDMGLCHTRRKDFRESIRCFNKALELEPENRDYQKMLGLTLAWVGQLDQGLAYLTRAQGSPLAHYNIARVLEQKNQTDLAKHHLRIALRENAQLEDAREMLAQLEGTSAAAAAASRALQGPQ